MGGAAGPVTAAGSAAATIARLPRCEEHKRYPDGRVKRFPLRLLDLSPTRAATVYVSDRPFRVQDICIPRGTITLGLFWANRPYNVYAWMNRALSVPLGLYCNVCDGCEIDARTIGWRDLWVDVLLRASGQSQVLDLDEVPRGTAPAIHRHLDAAVDCLLSRHRALENEVAAELAPMRRRLTAA